MPRIDRHYSRRFREVFANVAVNVPRTLAFNLDETQIHTQANRIMTLHRVGERSQVRANTDKNGNVLVLLCGISANGRRLPIMCKHKGTSWRSQLKFKKHGDLDLKLTGDQKQPWISANDLTDYVHRHILPITKNRPALLLLDHGTHHLDKDVHHYLDAHNVSVLMVPKRCTGQTQPLNVGIFGPVKAGMR